MIETEFTPYRFNWEYGYPLLDYSYMHYRNWAPVNTYSPYGYNYYPYGYHPYQPYTVYRQRNLIGRFYRVGPTPQWDNRLRRWITPFDRESEFEEEE